MTNETLTSAITDISRIAENHHHRLDVQLGLPCTQSQIKSVEAYVGVPLPASLKAFLSRHNGMRLSIDDMRVSGDLEFPYGKLEIYGTEDIIENTLSLRELLNDNDFQNDHGAKRKAYSCFDIGSVSAYSSNLRIVMSPKDIRHQAEYAICEADLEAMVWLSAIREDVTSILIAESCDELLERSIQNMLGGNKTFRYWNTRSAWKKYGGLTQTS